VIEIGTIPKAAHAWASKQSRTFLFRAGRKTAARIVTGTHLIFWRGRIKCHYLVAAMTLTIYGVLHHQMITQNYQQAEENGAALVEN